MFVDALRFFFVHLPRQTDGCPFLLRVSEGRSFTKAFYIYYCFLANGFRLRREEYFIRQRVISSTKSLPSNEY